MVEKARILLVDDEPNIIKALTARLEANHYEVVSASNGLEGLEEVRKGKPDLILLDINMPEMDGYSFVKALKREETMNSPPIIVLTARGDKMKDLFAIEGFQQYLVKPFDNKELLEKVKKHLG